MAEPQFVLYSRQLCHLCDDAKAVLHRFGLKYREIDIDRDVDSQRLVQQFGECVPVLEIDGIPRFRGRINELLLRRIIHQRGGG